MVPRREEVEEQEEDTGLTCHSDQGGLVWFRRLPS